MEWLPTWLLFQIGVTSDSPRDFENLAFALGRPHLAYDPVVLRHFGYIRVRVEEDKHYIIGADVEIYCLYCSVASNIGTNAFYLYNVTGGIRLYAGALVQEELSQGDVIKVVYSWIRGP